MHPPRRFLYVILQKAAIAFLSIRLIMDNTLPITSWPTGCRISPQYHGFAWTWPFKRLSASTYCSFCETKCVFLFTGSFPWTWDWVSCSGKLRLPAGSSVSFWDAQHLPYIYRSALWKTDPSKEKQTAFSALYPRFPYRTLQPYGLWKACPSALSTIYAERQTCRNPVRRCRSSEIYPTPTNPASECSMKSDSRQQLCRGSRTGSGTDPGFCQFTQ